MRFLSIELEDGGMPRGGGGRRRCLQCPPTTGLSIKFSRSVAPGANYSSRQAEVSAVPTPDNEIRIHGDWRRGKGPTLTGMAPTDSASSAGADQHQISPLGTTGSEFSRSSCGGLRRPATHRAFSFGRTGRRGYAPRASRTVPSGSPPSDGEGGYQTSPVSRTAGEFSSSSSRRPWPPPRQ